jgi:hypothetical protein
MVLQRLFGHSHQVGRVRAPSADIWGEPGRRPPGRPRRRPPRIGLHPDSELITASAVTPGNAGNDDRAHGTAEFQSELGGDGIACTGSNGAGMASFGPSCTDRRCGTATPRPPAGTPSGSGLTKTCWPMPSNGKKPGGPLSTKPLAQRSSASSATSWAAATADDEHGYAARQRSTPISTCSPRRTWPARPCSGCARRGAGGRWPDHERPSGPRTRSNATRSTPAS